MGTEEEERRLSNSEKSSLDVPLDALNRSKLPERGQHTHRHTQMETTHRMNEFGYLGKLSMQISDKLTG